MKSIRHRILFITLLVAVPLILFDIYKASQEAERRVDEVTRDLNRSTYAVVSKFSGLIDASHELLSSLATVEEVTGGDEAACSELLHRVGSLYSKYTNFSMVNRDKYIVCSSGPLPKKVLVKKSPNVNSALATGRFSISPFKFGVLTGKPILVFSEPIFDEDRQVIGTLNNGLSLTWLSQYLASVVKLEDEHIVVFDDQGTVLAAYPEGLYPVSASIGASDLSRSVLREQQGSGVFTLDDGRDAITVFTSVPGIPNGAHIAAFVPRDGLQTRILEDLFQRLMVLGGLVTLALLLGWVGARALLLAPISDLIGSAKALAAGNLKARSGVDPTMGELGQLGLAFNQMAESLDSRTEALAKSKQDIESANKTLRKMSLAVEQSPASVIITDTEGRIEYVNRHFEDITGYGIEEVVGKNPRFLKSGRTCVGEYKRLWETITGGGVWTGEFYNLRKDGSGFWERASIGALKNPGGEITNFIAIKEDISRLKEGERQQRLAAAVFETATEAVMVTDADNTIQTVNSAFCKITGYDPEDVIGKNPSMLQSGRHDKAYYESIYRALETNGTWEGEIWNRRKDGEAYAEWLAISIMRDSNNNLEGYVSLFSDITRRKEDEERILHQANFDPLTGLPNRNLLADRFSGALDRAERNHTQVAVLFIDLDRFKHVNDTLGHSIGDLLLQEAGKRLVRCLRKSDTAARLGGDEFAVVLADFTGLYAVEDVVNKILHSLAQPYHLDGNDAFISASIGVTVYPEDGESTEVLLRNADNAMYRAKEKGRNDFQFFTLEMDLEAQQRRELENALHQAVTRQEFTVCYQPIMDARSERIVSAEALIRWNHPEKGIVSPGMFIPLAEEIGVIVPIGEWVLRQACREAMSWSAVTDSPPSVSVNLSYRQFRRQSVPELVRDVLLETGLPPERLTLEITESLLVADDKATLKQLHELRKLGVGLSIDDFGTGYSSLSYLKKFPITTLKIDRSFIMDLLSNPEDKALVKGIVSMAENLGLKVVAEGVETENQVRFLQSIDCPCIQGFHYSRPLAKADLLTFIEFNHSESAQQLREALV